MSGKLYPQTILALRKVAEVLFDQQIKTQDQYTSRSGKMMQLSMLTMHAMELTSCTPGFA
jgi:hypothetical protein